MLQWDFCAHQASQWENHIIENVHVSHVFMTAYILQSNLQG